MRRLTSWLRTTIEYNPTFPISSLILMAGVYRLLAPVAGAIDVEHVGATASVLAGYELVLVGLALFVLWPRRIVYETTSALVIEGVLRFAPAVTLLLLDPRENLGAIVALGTAATALQALRAELAVRLAGLDARPWERIHASVVGLVASVGFPCFARFLLTAGSSARPAASLGAALVAVGIAPAFLFLGRGPLASERPLGSRQPIVVARILDTIFVGVLFVLSLWLNDVHLAWGSFAPFALLALLLVVASSAALRGDGLPGSLAGRIAAGAGVLALILVGACHPLAGRSLSPELLLAMNLPLALGLAAFLARKFPSTAARLGEKLALIALAAAPLRLLPSGETAAAYLGALSALTLVFALARKLERLAVATVAAGLAAVVLLGRLDLGAALAIAGAGLALMGSLRFGSSGIAERVGTWILIASGVVALALHGPRPLGLDTPSLDAYAGLAALAIAFLRGRTRAHLAALVGDATLVFLEPGHALAAAVVARTGDGVLLVALAFLALPVGVLVALRRERETQRTTPLL
jgi:hypothetical protein